MLKITYGGFDNKTAKNYVDSKLVFLWFLLFTQLFGLLVFFLFTKRPKLLAHLQLFGFRLHCIDIFDTNWNSTRVVICEKIYTGTDLLLFNVYFCLTCTIVPKTVNLLRITTVCP